MTLHLQGEPLENYKNSYGLTAKEVKKIATIPASLEEAINALEKDNEFLLKSNVFTKDVIDTWIGYKREREIDAVRLRPHPYEFYLYFDI